MIYVKFYADTPYCGTDNTEVWTYSDDTSIKEIEEDCETFGLENSESFEYLATGWDTEDLSEEEYDAIVEDFRSDCEWWYDIITKEEYEKEIE